MISGIESLQERVDAIRASGDEELVGRAWHALSKALFAYTRERKAIRRFPIERRINQQDVESFLEDLQEANRRKR